MLICIGSDENNLEGQVAKRFGHANYLILFNTETKNFESFINNNEGHNHDNLQEYLDKGVRVFIVGNIGPHAFEILKSGGSKVYLARKMNSVEALTAFNNDELKELLEPTVKKSMGNGKHEHEDEHNRHSSK
jgi:predicted Fe-Mo cluster-binding NifX family protein